MGVEEEDYSLHISHRLEDEILVLPKGGWKQRPEMEK